MIQNGSEHHDGWLNGQDKSYPHSEPRRVILLVATAGTISERLIHALTREFPWIAIEQVEQVSAVCAAFAHPVSLILVDAAQLRAVEDASAEFLRMHPNALTAVIENDSHSHADNLLEILRSPLVRGILPMNLRLDVWLSVIRLMLCGGEYYPPGIFRSVAGTIGQARPIAKPQAQGTSGNDISGLTAREIQILEMVSRGLQNKTIAAEFDLSEHTVKIHLHNIISKLGAHNRTEAAAKFRNFQLHNASQAPNQFSPSGKDRFAEQRLASLSASRTKA